MQRPAWANHHGRLSQARFARGRFKTGRIYYSRWDPISLHHPLIIRQSKAYIKCDFSFTLLKRPWKTEPENNTFSCIPFCTSPLANWKEVACLHKSLERWYGLPSPHHTRSNSTVPNDHGNYWTPSLTYKKTVSLETSQLILELLKHKEKLLQAIMVSN